MQKRLDAKWLAFGGTPTWAYPAIPLGQLTSQEPDYGSGARAIAMQTGDEPRYIRITDFSEDGIADDNDYTTPEIVEPDCMLEAQDMLFARSGATVGKTYLHEDAAHPSVFAGYCIRFRFNRSKTLPRFVWFFTKTAAFSRWLLAIQRPSGQPNINKEEFKSFKLPLPLIDKQRELVAAMEAAREARRTKLAEADALLAGLDAYLLEILGLTPPNAPRKVFAIHASQLSNALAAERYVALQLEDRLHWHGTVADAVKLTEGRTAPSREAPDADWDWIRIDDLPNQPWQVDTLRTVAGAEIEGALYAVHEDDILLARLGPTILNAKFVLAPKPVRQTVASPEFLVCAASVAGSRKSCCGCCG